MRRLFSYLTVVFCFNAFGQNLIPNYEIGSYIDYNKKIINGYYDFDYESKSSLNVNYDAVENFSKGYCFDNKGVRAELLLKYSKFDRELKFKVKENDLERSIKAEQTNGYIIGIDTFSVVKNAMIAGFFSGFKLSNKKEFAENIENIGGIRFYKFSGQAGNGTSYVKYIVKKDEVSDFKTFPDNKEKFNEMAADIFGSDPVLLASIRNGKYAEENIPSMIKIFKYRKLYNNGQNIFYNSFRDETNNADKFAFYSKVESVQDSVFHLSHFFKNNVKIYEGDFTSFYPHKKQGDFLYYYADGKVRKKVSYVNKNPKNVVEFYENGEIHRIFDMSKEGEVTYKEVYNNEEKNVLNASGNGEESFFDIITNKTITYEYEKNMLIRAYFIDKNGEKIYQLCESNAEIKKFKNLQKQAKEKLLYPLESLQQNSHGFVLVKCIIEQTGLVSEIEIIKGLDPACDKSTIDFLSCFKSEIYWKQGKVNGIPVKQEIVFPIDFSINTTSAYRNNYYNSWFFHNMMFQQQQMMMQQQQSMMRSVGGFR